MAFSWQCPFCGQHATITEDNVADDYFEFDLENKYGRQRVQNRVITCPNGACREYTMTVSLHDGIRPGGYSRRAKKVWKLIPEAEMQVFPDYVPEAVLGDYREACLVVDKSPKASATLSRRCLQGMIRDYWSVSGKSRLYDEIEAIKDKLDPVTWDAIDSVRKIGNIGAHMEKDIDLIIDVDPDEATTLIQLIETLIQEWYINSYVRQQRMEKVKAIAETKKSAKAENRMQE